MFIAATMELLLFGLATALLPMKPAGKYPDAEDYYCA